MNLTEAHATQTVLAWLAGLRLVETTPDAPTDARLVEAVAVLAERSHRALGAGLRRETAVTALTTALDHELDPGAQLDERTRLHELGTGSRRWGWSCTRCVIDAPALGGRPEADQLAGTHDRLHHGGQPTAWVCLDDPHTTRGAA